MQEVLSRLTQQQDARNQESQKSPEPQLSSEASRHSTLVLQLKQMVSEKEAKVKELEKEIQQMSSKVRDFNWNKCLRIDAPITNSQQNLSLKLNFSGSIPSGHVLHYYPPLCHQVPVCLHRL